MRQSVAMNIFFRLLADLSLLRLARMLSARRLSLFLMFKNSKTLTRFQNVSKKMAILDMSFI